MVDDLVRQARNVGFQLNERKCKDLRIGFARKEPVFHPLCVNNGPQTLETVNSVKLLGLTINGDIKWNANLCRGLLSGMLSRFKLRRLKVPE